MIIHSCSGYYYSATSKHEISAYPAGASSCPLALSSLCAAGYSKRNGICYPGQSMRGLLPGIKVKLPLRLRLQFPSNNSESPRHGDFAPLARIKLPDSCSPLLRHVQRRNHLGRQILKLQYPVADPVMGMEGYCGRSPGTRHSTTRMDSPIVWVRWSV